TRAPSTTTAVPSTTTTTTEVGPTPAPATIGLLAFGDAGSGDITQMQVAQQMQNWAGTHRVDALLEAGDIVYPDGSPARFAAAIDAPYATLRASIPFWPALGNHDVMWNNGNDLMSYVSMPGRSYEKWITNGNVTMQLLVLDSNNVSPTQTAWLESKLSSGSPRWRVVMFHHPVFSCSSHGNTQAVINAWLPVLTAHDVDLVITGHDHNYQRFQQGNTTFVVTGGGGMPTTYPINACVATPPLQASAQRHHFLGIEATAMGLTLTAVARTGETLDQFSMS
ncbi:MAG: metallophosphoesterase, partial [Acidimicrobiia bacterium]|nr:metallophosphoesterase [Acidimicrobiia bacterium]